MRGHLVLNIESWVPYLDLPLFDGFPTDVVISVDGRTVCMLVHPLLQSSDDVSADVVVKRVNREPLATRAS